MKICLYYKTIDDITGGANSFIRNLELFLRSSGFDISHELDDDYDVLFLNGANKAPGKFFSYNNIYRLRRTGYSNPLKRVVSGRKKKTVKILYRLDGLRKVYANIENKMDEIQLKAIKLADHIIFQSKFSCDIFRQFGYGGNNFTIIHNGVDDKIFNMTGKNMWNGKDPLKVASCSWSNNIAKGHRIISELSLLDGVDVSFVGNWAKGVPLNCVNIKSPAHQSEIAKFFKESHIFIFPSLNESCSNVLLEALACGLPVLYEDSGSNKEIARDYGVKIDSGNLANALKEAKDGYLTFSENIKRDVYKFSIKHAGEKYIEAIAKV